MNEVDKIYEVVRDLVYEPNDDYLIVMIENNLALKGIKSKVTVIDHLNQVFEIKTETLTYQLSFKNSI